MTSRPQPAAHRMANCIDSLEVLSELAVKVVRHVAQHPDRAHWARLLRRIRRNIDSALAALEGQSDDAPRDTDVGGAIGARSRVAPRTERQATTRGVYRDDRPATNPDERLAQETW